MENVLFVDIRKLFVFRKPFILEARDRGCEAESHYFEQTLGIGLHRVEKYKTFPPLAALEPKKKSFSIKVTFVVSPSCGRHWAKEAFRRIGHWRTITYKARRASTPSHSQQTGNILRETLAEPKYFPDDGGTKTYFSLCVECVSS